MQVLGAAMTGKLSVAAAIATLVWFKEYGAGRGANLPIFHWWFSDLTRFLNSFVTSFIDYTFGVLGFLFPFVANDKLAHAISEALVLPIGLKKAVDLLLPLDHWRSFQWDNKVANWAGHFAFAALLVLLVTSILRRPIKLGARVILVVALALPLAGILVGQLALV